MNFFNLVPQVYADPPMPSGTGNDVVGTIAVPSGIPQEVGKTGSFISGLVRFIIIIAGLFALWNFLSGGLEYITSGGDKAKISEATQKITMSIVGLVIIAASFLIAAIMGQLLFGNPMAILAPDLVVIQ